MENYQTIAKKAEQEIKQTLFSYTGNQKVKVVCYDCTSIDFFTYINEKARFREGYQETEDSLIIPTFFIKLNGMTEEMDNAYFLGNPMRKENIKEFLSIPNALLLNQWIFELPFRSDVKKKVIWKGSSYIQNFSKEMQGWYAKRVKEFLVPITDHSKRKRLQMALLNLHPSIYRAIREMEYGEELPKILITRNVTKTEFQVLKFLNGLGMDVIFSSVENEVTAEQYEYITIINLPCVLDSSMEEQKTSRKIKEKVFCAISTMFCMLFLPFHFLINLGISLLMAGIIIGISYWKNRKKEDKEKQDFSELRTFVIGILLTIAFIVWFCYGLLSMPIWGVILVIVIFLALLAACFLDELNE